MLPRGKLGPLPHAHAASPRLAVVALGSANLAKLGGRGSTITPFPCRIRQPPTHVGANFSRRWIIAGFSSRGDGGLPHTPSAVLEGAGEEAFKRVCGGGAITPSMARRSQWVRPKGGMRTHNFMTLASEPSTRAGRPKS